MKSVFVHVSHNGNDIVEGAEMTVIDAIRHLHGAIDTLRSHAAHSIDPSFGEQPQALLAPSENELAELVRSSTSITNF